MARHPTEPHHLQSVQEFVDCQAGLEHLRCRSRADVITLESGPPEDPYPHARLRRVAVDLWRLEMPTRSGRWEPTPARGPLSDVLSSLISDFGWVLEPVDENPARISDRYD